MWLATTRSTQVWPENQPLWLLTPGCAPLEHGAWQIQGIISDPFRNGNKNTAVYREIWSLTNELVEYLSRQLNTIHKENHSVQYWRIHIGFWALNYVTMMMDRYTRLKHALREQPKLKIIACKTSDMAIFDTTSESIDHARDDDWYNLQTYALLADMLKIPKKSFHGKPEAAAVEHLYAYNRSILRRILVSAIGLLHSAIVRIFARRAEILTEESYFPRWFQFILFFRSFGNILSMGNTAYKSQFLSKKTNTQIRRKISQIPKNAKGVTRAIFAHVGRFIPRVFIEAYPELGADVRKRYESLSPKILFSTISWYYDEVFKHWAAECQTRGTLLVGGEHGGAPFLGRYFNYESLEIQNSDCYLTWGWSDHKKPKILGTPANILIRSTENNKIPSSDTIMYIGTSDSRYNVAALEDFSAYLEWQHAFFKRVNSSLIPKFLMRLHYHDFGWGIRRNLQKRHPELQFDQWEVSFRKRLQKRNIRLFILDYLSTTFSETLALNLPTVLYFDKSRYPLIETWRDAFEPLQDCGILQNTPAQAADWINKNWPKIPEWFYSAHVQKSRKEFCNRFALRTRSSGAKWVQILKSVPTISQSFVHERPVQRM